MAEFNLGHFIDKDYLKNSFINYDKDFLLKKYYLKSKGEGIENKIKEFAEETNERINKSKFEKYYLENEGDLPNPNEADNGIYIVRDKKSIDETCNCFLYTTIETEDGKKAWKILSAPSYVFETENLDYDKEFEKYKRKDKYSGYHCFYNYEKLFNAITKLTTQTPDGRYVYDFFRNSEYNFEYIEISALGAEARYKSLDKENSEFISYRKWGYDEIDDKLKSLLDSNNGALLIEK